MVLLPNCCIVIVTQQYVVGVASCGAFEYERAVKREVHRLYLYAVFSYYTGPCRQLAGKVGYVNVADGESHSSVVARVGLWHGTLGT